MLSVGHFVLFLSLCVPLMENKRKCFKMVIMFLQLQYDWCFNIGEQAVDIAVVSFLQSQPSILILGGQFCLYIIEQKNIFYMFCSSFLKKFQMVKFSYMTVKSNILLETQSESNPLTLHQQQEYIPLSLTNTHSTHHLTNY